jgi:ATP-binding cassette subfamily F protein 3
MAPVRSSAAAAYETKGFKDYTQTIAKGMAQKAKSREKKLERYLEADERVEKPKQSWQMRVDFGDLPESGKDVLRLDKVSVGYGDLVLLRVTLSIRHGERLRSSARTARANRR